MVFLLRLVLVRRDKVVANHMARLKARPRQLEVDPECLRWTPVIVTNTVVSDADGDDDDEDEEGPEGDSRKDVGLSLRPRQKCFCSASSFILTAFVLICNQVKPSHNFSSSAWQIQQARTKDEEDEDDEEEERKGFLGFPVSQSSPASPPVRSQAAPSDHPRPFLPANGERRPRGRPPKNWPWGKLNNSPRVGRPSKMRPMDDKDDEDEETTVEGKPSSSSRSPPSLFSLDHQADSPAFQGLNMARHPSVTPTRRGRPPRKKRGPKPRLADGEGLMPLSVMSRLSDALPVRRSHFSESSEEEEDEDEEENRACSPPILTKTAMGLKCKVRTSSFMFLAAAGKKWN